jgi:hypothetical protein
MRARPARRVLAFSLLVASAFVGGGAALTASADTREPVINYQGTMTLTSSEGDSANLTVLLSVDCTNSPCTARTTLIAGDYGASPSNDLALPLTNGKLNTSLPAYGDICNNHFLGGGGLTIELTVTDVAVTRTSAPTGPISCPGGFEVTSYQSTMTGRLAYQSGSACLIFNTCVDAKPTHSAKPHSAASSTIAFSLPAEPSQLSHLPAAHPLSASQVAWTAGGAVLLVAIVGFPSVLLDSASERVTTAIGNRRRDKSQKARDAVAAPPLTVIGWPIAIVGLLVAAVASAFIDPGFGLSSEGLRIALTIVVAFATAIALGWAFVSVVMRVSRPESAPRVEFRPLTLLVVAAAVLVSRLTGFEPGFIFGLVAGIGFGTALAVADRARAALLGIGYLLVISLTAWVGYSVLLGSIGSHPDWMPRLALESLSAIAITGMTALPIALLPLRGLTGRVVWEWHRWIWAIAYALVIAGFLLLLMPLPASWQQVHSSLWVWAAGFAAYAVVSVVVWLVVVRPWTVSQPE